MSPAQALDRRGWAGSAFFGLIIIGFVQAAAALMGFWSVDAALPLVGVGVAAAVLFEWAHRRADQRRFADAVALSKALIRAQAGSGAAGWHAGAPYARGRWADLNFVCHFETAGIDGMRVALAVTAEASAPLWVTLKEGPRPERFLRRLGRHCRRLDGEGITAMALDPELSEPLVADPEFEAEVVALLSRDEGAVVDIQGDGAGWDAPLTAALTAEGLLDRVACLGRLAEHARRAAPLPTLPEEAPPEETPPEETPS